MSIHWGRVSYELLQRCVNFSVQITLQIIRIFCIKILPLLIPYLLVSCMSCIQVKRRYLDWRAMMKRKQFQAELSLSSSSSSSFALKTEYDPSTPEHEAASLESGCDQLLDLSSLPKDYHCDWPELAALNECGQATMAPPGVKMEDNVCEYRVRNRNSSSTPYCHSTACVCTITVRQKVYFNTTGSLYRL